MKKVSTLKVQFSEPAFIGRTLDGPSHCYTLSPGLYNLRHRQKTQHGFGRIVTGPFLPVAGRTHTARLRQHCDRTLVARRWTHTHSTATAALQATTGYGSIVTELLPVLQSVVA